MLLVAGQPFKDLDELRLHEIVELGKSCEVGWGARQALEYGNLVGRKRSR